MIESWEKRVLGIDGEDGLEVAFPSLHLLSL